MKKMPPLRCFYGEGGYKHMEQRNLRYEAAARALTRFGTDLVRFAYSYLLNHQDAQDAVQDVLLSYMRRAPRFEGEAQERAWLLRATANRCKNVLRSSWFKTRAPLPEELPQEPESRELIQALGKLPDKYRTPLHLHYYEGYSIAEIAGILGARTATVGTWLARGREKLKEQLGGYEDE